MVVILSPLFLFLLLSILVHRTISWISPLARSQPLKTRVLLASTSSSSSTTTVPKSSSTMSKTGSKGPVFEAEEVSYNIPRPSGHLLEGTLTVPKDSKREGRVIVFLHGTHSNRNHNFVPELCTKLVKDHGIASYRFDFRVGSTAAEPDHRYKFSGYNDDLNDLDCVIRNLVQTGFTICGIIYTHLRPHTHLSIEMPSNNSLTTLVHPTGIFGHSRGANDALLYASSRLLQDGISGGDDNRACANTVFQQMNSQATTAAAASSSSGTSTSLYTY